MAEQVTLQFPDGAFSALRRNPADFADELKRAAVCKWYELGVIRQLRSWSLIACASGAAGSRKGRPDRSAELCDGHHDGCACSNGCTSLARRAQQRNRMQARPVLETGLRVTNRYEIDAVMRLYRGLKEPYRPLRTEPQRSARGVDFTDCAYVATQYASTRRGVVLVLHLGNENPGIHVQEDRLHELSPRT